MSFYFDDGPHYMLGLPGEYANVYFHILHDRIIKVILNDEDELKFITNDGYIYLMNHEQSCCETVSIEDICGDLEDLLNTPILLAEEANSEEDPPCTDGYTPESHTWTFYKLATVKGAVTIRWLGTSNGWYSESVEFVEFKINFKTASKDNLLQFYTEEEIGLILLQRLGE